MNSKKFFAVFSYPRIVLSDNSLRGLSEKMLDKGLLPLSCLFYIKEGNSKIRKMEEKEIGGIYSDSMSRAIMEWL